ncbi:MAG: glycosyltransferase family 4 protein [Candidatus Omnitrophica bacterium]|nr:glycosyltransferase family 4 protein [Candidatus Omnitrophota bacterium]
MITKNDILVSHAGKQHSYKLAISLQNMGRLSRFATSSYYDPSRFPDTFFSRFTKLDKILKKRHEPGLSDKVRRFPFFEVPEIILRTLLGNKKISSDATCLRDMLFDRFVSKTQIYNSGIFWGFQGSCLESLKAAKRKGIIAIAEFATAHVTAAIRILEEERKRNPEWADSINNLCFPNWYLKRLKEEPFLADFCVAASEFSKKTLEDANVESKKILLLPLGASLEKFKFKKRKIKSNFQVLFVGSVGQRKGMKYLLEAIKMLRSNKVVTKIVGPIVGSGKAFRSYSNYYEYLGCLTQEEVLKVMHESDCLVLPSLLEGFGLVIPEAMASGMPVIATTHTAAPEIIREGRDGFILEPCDARGLAGKLDWLATHKEKSIEMGQDAREGSEKFSWKKHQERLKQILQVIEDER